MVYILVECYLTNNLQNPRKKKDKQIYGMMHTADRW